MRGLTRDELREQGERCPCGGVDDYCVCQNVPDRVTAKAWGLVDHSAAPPQPLLPVPDPYEEAATVLKALTDAQDVLANYIVPDSGITELEAVNALLSILDHKDVVIAARKLRPLSKRSL